MAGRVLSISVRHSIRLSFLLAVFLELAYQFFTETLLDVRSPCGDVRNMMYVFGKILIGQKWSIMALK